MDSLDLFLAQSVKITNWLTPVWMMSMGIGFGFLLVLVGVLKIWIGARIPGLNTLAENKTSRIVAGSVIGLIYAGLASWLYFYLSDAKSLSALDEDFALFLILTLPFCLFLGFGAVQMVSRKSAPEALGMFREGLLFWVNLVCIGAIAFAAGGYVLGVFGGFGLIKFVDDPDMMLNSVGRIPYGGRTTHTFEIQPTTENSSGQEVDVSFYGQEVKFIQFQSNQRVEIAAEPITEVLDPGRMFYIPATSETEPQVFVPRIDKQGPIPLTKVERLWIVNLGSSPADVTIMYQTGPIYGQVWIMLWAAGFVVVLYFAYLAFGTLFPKVFAIALSTFKTEISQPLFLIVMIIGVLFVLGSVYVPYNTFGEDIKMYKDSVLTLIKVLAIFMAIWAASKSVAEEIEGRTALTVLSKPVSRRQFILGKLSGISLAVALLFILLGVWFFIWTAYKPVYDAREMSKGIVEWANTFDQAVSIIPAMFLGFLEVIVFVSISVAISTRFGILANFLICFAIYVLGHLTPLIVQSAEAAQAFETVGFFGQLIAIVFPVLNHFDVQAAINTNRGVPLDYIGWSIIYCGLYGTMTMLLALVLFEDRDLA